MPVPVDVISCAKMEKGAPLHHSFFDVADAQATSSYIVPSSGTFYQYDFVFNEPLSGGMRAVMDIAQHGAMACDASKLLLLARVL